jgi:hypothetical protein
VADGAWSQAHRKAAELGLDYVGTDLLLLGLTQGGGVAAEVLAELGATEESVSSVVARLLTSAPPSREPGRKEHPRPTPAAEHARGRAEGIAIGLGVSEATVHTLLALAYDRHGVHASVLRILGVDRREIVRRLAARGIEVPADPPPPDPAPHTESVVLPDAQARLVAAELGRRSTERPDWFFDAWGGGSWGYGQMPDRPGDSRISAEPRIGLRPIVIDVLRSAGQPAPPEDAWETTLP